MLKWLWWRWLRLRCLEVRMLLLKSRILCLKRGYLTGYEPNLGENSVLLGVVANHPLKFFNVLRDAAHIVGQSLMRPNEIKMSDGGRDRPSLGVEGWKSPQDQCVQRSAVRSIDRLDLSDHIWQG
jgi:hypothetical protein